MNTRSFLTLAVLSLPGFFYAGCEAAHSSPAMITADSAQHAECLVCKQNADLACLDVTVTPKTPHLLYLGNNYYFCSTECRDDFQKNPEKYTPKK